MATKVNLMKLLQEMRGMSEMRKLQSGAKPSPLLWMQLRRVPRSGRNARQRIPVVVATDERNSLPDPVPIRFIANASGASGAASDR